MYRQSEVLIKSGFDVFNVVSDTVPDEVEHGVKILSSGYVTNNRIKRVLFSSKNLRKRLFEVDADIYHTCHIDQLGTCLKLKKAGKKVIFEMQEDHPYSLYWKSRLPHFLNHFFVCLMKLWMSYALKRVDAITCVGYDTYDYLVSWGIDKKKIHVIGNFPIVRKDYKLTREDYMSRENRILYFGLIYSYSRQEVFLEALKKLHVNVKYLVAGKFMGNELKTYRVQTMNNPLWKEKVEFVEGFKHDELKDFVKENDIEIGVLTIPKTKAVEVANLLVDNGVKAIWNFAHTDLNLPDNIIVENVHLSESLMRLSYNITRYNEEHEGK